MPFSDPSIPPLPLDLNGRAIFYDLEYTSWKGFRESNWSMPGKYMEIVQIGAVRIDFDDRWREVDNFVGYVQPKKNPVLSDYFVELTGITQKIVDDRGMDFSRALECFVDYVNGDGATLASHGPDHEVIALNCEYNDLPVPAPFRRAVNLRPWIANQAGVTEARYTSGELPDALGVTHDEAAHDALSDARAVVSVLRHLYNKEA